MVDMEVRNLEVNGQHPLFDRSGLFYKEFPSDYRQIRYYTLLIVQKAPQEIRELNLLEQQISELIKNAIKHGNANDPQKKVRVWFSFNTDQARLIVQDEGPGFQSLEEWNDFNSRRVQCLAEERFDELADFIAYRTERSDFSDGGNALFAAVEYWTDGVVFSDERNTVAVGKTFSKKRHRS